MGMDHLLGRGGGQETATEDGHEPLVGIGETVLRHVTDFKHDVDLYGFSWLVFVSSHGALLSGPSAAARSQYQAVREHRGIPGRSWRAIAPVRCLSRTLRSVWQYCRRGEHRALSCPPLREHGLILHEDRTL